MRKWKNNSTLFIVRRSNKRVRSNFYFLALFAFFVVIAFLFGIESIGARRLPQR